MNREIEIEIERINERMVRAYGRELQPLEAEAIRQDLKKVYCVQCKTKQARWDSIYCSDGCKRSFYSELRGGVR